jgi:hypothetical protein
MAIAAIATASTVITATGTDRDGPRTVRDARTGAPDPAGAAASQRPPSPTKPAVLSFLRSPSPPTLDWPAHSLLPYLLLFDDIARYVPL